MAGEMGHAIMVVYPYLPMPLFIPTPVDLRCLATFFGSKELDDVEEEGPGLEHAARCMDGHELGMLGLGGGGGARLHVC